MTNPDKTSAYDFESQLRLGEMLLGLGRIQEAEVELKKARDLNEIGAYTTADDDPQRQSDLQRLQTALKRVEEIRTGASRSSRRWWALATGAMALLLIAMFVAWVFNRATLIETTTSGTREAELLFAQQTEIAYAKQLADAENTRTVGEIVLRDRQIATISAENTQMAIFAGVAAESAQAASTAAAISAAMAARAEQQGSLVDTGLSVLPTIIVVITSEAPAQPPAAGATPLPTVQFATPVGVVAPPDADTQLRITGVAANLRFGPDFGYAIIATLRNNDIVKLLAMSEDTYWYNVQTEDGLVGWVHSSLAKPLSLDWLPIITPIPPTATRTRIPTATPTPPPTNTPTSVPPTAVPPTAVPPTAEPPTPEPPTAEPPTAEPPTPEPPTAEPSGAVQPPNALATLIPPGITPVPIVVPLPTP